ncbi:interferon-induced protein 44-like isoform X2 [Anguilla anguilla]|nr:interferon-induced protein 44-like isoform X2 [Anguilla anguilla]
MYRRVSLMSYVGSTPKGFTKKLKSYEIRAEKGGPPTPLTLCDVLALGESEETGLTLHDTLEVIKGHVPEGHKFQSNAPINHATAGYQLAPALKDRIHCVVFVLDASEVLFYSKSLEDKLRELRWELSDMDIPHVILLTKVDQVCKAVEADVQYVYRSRIVKERVHKAAELMGLPMSFVLPVKNYSSELSVNCNTDILLLSALNCILHSISDGFDDYTSS